MIYRSNNTPPTPLLPVEARIGYDPPIRYLLMYFTDRPLCSEVIWSDAGECPAFTSPEQATAVAVAHRLPLGRLWLFALDAASYAIRTRTAAEVMDYHEAMTFDVSRDEAERGRRRKLGGRPMVLS